MIQSHFLVMERAKFEISCIEKLPVGVERFSRAVESPCLIFTLNTLNAFVGKFLAMAILEVSLVLAYKF